jgi:hypothetical protein
VLGLLLAAPLGCATQRSAETRPSTVSEADYARLPPQQARRVDEARDLLVAAREELGRAKLSVLTDRHEGAFARSDQASAAADLSRAAAETKVGQDSNEPGQVEQAKDDTLSAQQGKASADARSAYAKKLAISRASTVTAAELKVALMLERLNEAKLLALEECGIPAAGKYDRAAVQGRVAKALRVHEEATRTAAASERETSLAYQQWRPAAR